MFDFGIFHNGGCDLALDRQVAGEDFRITGASLAQLHESYQRVLVDQVRQGVLAEELGFAYYFMTEHHFNTEGLEFSPNPLLVQTAIAAQTSTIRLGQATNILAQWEPLRIAEQAAMLDVISGGRLEFGVGRGYQQREVETFGFTLGSSIQDEERNRAYVAEAIEVILAAWTNDAFSHTGDYFSIPPKHALWNNEVTAAMFANADSAVPEMIRTEEGRSYLGKLAVFPQPVQKPHPQLWMPATTPRSITQAARGGMNGILNASARSRTRMAAELFHESAAGAGWPDRLNRGEFMYGWDPYKRRGVGNTLWVHIVDDRPGEAQRVEQFLASIDTTFRFFKTFGFGAGAHEIDETIDPDLTVTAKLLLERNMIVVGTAEHVVEKLLEMQNYLGFDCMLLIVHFEAAGLTGVEVEDQMVRFAEQVMPHLDRVPELAGV